jgi:hypothetical protein
MANQLDKLLFGIEPEQVLTYCDHEFTLVPASYTESYRLHCLTCKVRYFFVITTSTPAELLHDIKERHADSSSTSLPSPWLPYVSATEDAGLQETLVSTSEVSTGPDLGHVPTGPGDRQEPERELPGRSDGVPELLGESCLTTQDSGTMRSLGLRRSIVSFVSQLGSKLTRAPSTINSPGTSGSRQPSDSGSTVSTGGRELPSLTFRYQLQVSVKFLFEPRDAWMGIYWDKEPTANPNCTDKLVTYICLVPFVVFRVTFHFSGKTHPTT